MTNTTPTHARIFATFTILGFGLALALFAPACGGDSDSDTPGSSSQTLTEQFCSESIKACSTVSLPACQKIVADAGKQTIQADIDCAKEATSCEDTSACLEQMSSGSPSSQPTSQPTS